ncbi:MAG: PD40 domain-containing protein [Dehalococcoidia bacterium]|nr:PD40 domain-containing protein [Dehalococcoidia bacterium]
MTKSVSPITPMAVLRLRALHWGLILAMMVLVLGTACSSGGGGLTKLGGGEGDGEVDGPDDGLPAWSPDGSRIAFISTVIDTSIHIGSPYKSSICVMDADGGNRCQVAGNATSVSWSPGGDEMIFSTDQGGLGVMDIDGGNIRHVLADQPGDLAATLHRPSYSPDGTKIVFMKCVRFPDLNYPGSTMSYWQVFVVGIDGTNLTKLSADRVDDRQPVWSPDGSKIAFTSYRDEHWGIYVMDADGSNVVGLTDDGETEGFPVWSPDGKRIAFTFTYDGDGKTEIYVMNSDGSDVVRLTSNSIEERSLSWLPDGTELAVEGADPIRNEEEWPDTYGNGHIYLLKMA